MTFRYNKSFESNGILIRENHSFFSLSLLLEHDYLLCTAYLLCLDISSSVQTKKNKKQLVHAFSPLLLLAKVANECFKCAKKVIRVY